jgi:hypothetical protein
MPAAKRVLLRRDAPFSLKRIVFHDICQGVLFKTFFTKTELFSINKSSAITRMPNRINLSFASACDGLALG